MSRGVPMVFAAGLLAGCQEYPLARPFAALGVAPAPNPTPAELVDRAAICGRGLGIAVRCNLIGGDNDFAVLRYVTLDGLRAQSPGTVDFGQVEMALDVATLEMLNTVGQCTASGAQLPMLEREIETTLATCTAP